ncbi:hypothetical protein Ciccas_014466, partial [Cichlidogyrus casuarinus]
SLTSDTNAAKEPKAVSQLSVKIPKKRGPKKKPLTKEREVKLKIRRARANTRERNRMHGLNYALEALRKTVPSFSNSQRLSKIETLRIARNYIMVLNELLENDGVMHPLKMALTLTDGLTQNTTNTIAGQLRVNATDIHQWRKMHGHQEASEHSGSVSSYGHDNNSFTSLDASSEFHLFSTDCSIRSACELLQSFQTGFQSHLVNTSLPTTPESQPCDTFLR